MYKKEDHCVLNLLEKFISTSMLFFKARKNSFNIYPYEKKIYN
jgi:hypothetical protein